MTIRPDDFKDADGKLDWQGYCRARVEIGELCDGCGDLIIWAKGHRSLCSDCERLQNEPGEAWHQNLIRCPCGAQYHASRFGESGVYAEGEHELFCDTCEQEFAITVDVVYYFYSPPRR